MKFLIDECLHTSLVAIAQDAGYICDHVNFLGLGGYKDWQLMPKIRTGEYAFVTNDMAHFMRIYGQEELHAGLVILIPSVTPSRQRELFRAALSHIGHRDLINTVVEVDIVRDGITCREYEYP
jgi:predicted nuclease of predicted toxin-antitoxin system